MQFHLSAPTPQTLGVLRLGAIGIGSRAFIVDEVGPGVGHRQAQALGKTVFEARLHGMVVAVAVTVPHADAAERRIWPTRLESQQVSGRLRVSEWWREIDRPGSAMH
jgi:hypothetical protein